MQTNLVKHGVAISGKIVRQEKDEDCLNQLELNLYQQPNL
jgi:hypothetical protein